MPQSIRLPLKIRRYGRTGPVVIVLHGGPAAAGSSRRLALSLADTFRVLEPWQRGSEPDRPLTVARHIADLDQIIRSHCLNERPALVGESWGAMLALAYGAEHPLPCGPIVLVGCGTFDPHSRERVLQIRAQRIATHLAKHPQSDWGRALPPADQIVRWHTVTDNYAPISTEELRIDDNFDPKANRETWEDMLRCQENGQYPRTFCAITGPVLMLHGAYDPHPGRLIRDTLKAVMPQLEYREFERCGHHPVNERWAREAFLTALKSWLVDKMMPLAP